MPRIVIGISGASGAIYGVRLLEVLEHIPDVETHLIITEHGERTLLHETDYNLSDVHNMADYCHDVRDIGASLASGSFQRDGMVVAPCTIKTMSALAHSYSDNLLVRAADVCLKESKKLVLVVRETPLHLGHLRNLTRLAEMGAVIFPPVPAFYHRPTTIAELVDATVGRILDVFGVEHSLFERWSSGKC